MMIEIENLVAQINTAVQSQQYEEANHLLQYLNAADIALVLQHFDPWHQVELLHLLSNKADVFSFYSPAQRVRLAEQLNITDLVEIIEQMHSDDSADLVKALSPIVQKQLYTRLSLNKRLQIRSLAAYQEESAGAIMSLDVATLPAEITIQHAIEQLRQDTSNPDTLYQIYIVNEHKQLQGVISLREIILANPEDIVADVMHKEVIYAHVDDDQESVVKKLSYYDFIALPIVNDQMQLLGIVTYDDALDVVSEEATEDFLKSGAVNANSKLSLKTAPILQLYQKRVFWLVFLVFGSLLSGFGIAHFEDIIASNLVLVFFLPLLVGSGGNAGSQSATLMVRALATGDVHFKDWFYLIGRESLVAICLGGTMAIAVSALGYYRGDSMVALVLALSMMAIVMLGCLIGMSLPFILNRMGLDPASASAPLVTSICDASGVLVYLFIASQLLL
ncbi:magnesium transporter [Acinetobacter chengduensis]|jgi:magnesium transporter|uniref:Magnesium transporter MgtE n=2 Tax=Moraxellaceae TaxID=468 RepID=A0ABX9U152_9GAMM|nr:magnesium transporter [Acinetobacter sp. FL51]RKG42294.1 magnesium transporter [Acinetobacter sp. WCHAc060007]RLL24059.1 magnesium transporter [Acinetobacter chengduensis]